jgi:cell division protein FtsL
MTRLQLVLLVVLVGSSLALVRTAYDARRLFSEIEKAEREERRLAAELQRLDADRQVQATHLRVEKLARERLRMRTATAAVTQYVEDAAATGGVR